MFLNFLLEKFTHTPLYRKELLTHELIKRVDNLNWQRKRNCNIEKLMGKGLKGHILNFVRVANSVDKIQIFMCHFSSNVALQFL